MRASRETGGRRLARNSIVNLGSQALPVLMALLFIPPVLLKKLLAEPGDIKPRWIGFHMVV